MGWRSRIGWAWVALMLSSCGAPQEETSTEPVDPIYGRNPWPDPPEPEPTPTDGAGTPVAHPQDPGTDTSTPPATPPRGPRSLRPPLQNPVTLEEPLILIPDEYDLLVSETEIYEVKTERTFTKDSYGRVFGKGGHALPEAIKRLSPGRPWVIRLVGHHPAMSLGGGNKYRAGYQKDEVGNPMPLGARGEVWITGDPNDRGAATIGEVGIQSGLGGVENVHFANLTFRSGPGDKWNLLVYMRTNHGLIGLHNCTFQGTPNHKSFNGTGVLSHVRGHGCAQWQITNCHGTGAQEHFLYLDRPGAKNNGLSVITDCTGERFGRTFIQIVGRGAPANPRGETVAGGPPSFAPLIVRRNRVERVDIELGGGGSAYTFVGHGGPIDFADNSVEGGTGGALVFYTDTGKGVHRFDPEGEHLGMSLWDGEYESGAEFSHTWVAIRNFHCRMDKQDANGRRAREPISISGIARLTISGLDANGAGSALHLFPRPYGGPLDNGTVTLDLDGKANAYEGLHGLPVRYAGATLDNAALLDLDPRTR